MPWQVWQAVARFLPAAASPACAESGTRVAARTRSGRIIGRARTLRSVKTCPLASERDARPLPNVREGALRLSATWRLTCGEAPSHKRLLLVGDPVDRPGGI